MNHEPRSILILSDEVFSKPCENSEIKMLLINGRHNPINILMPEPQEPFCPKCHKGELIYHGISLEIPFEQCLDSYLLNNQYTLTKKQHFVNCGHFFRVSTFDSFMNHSCSPNTYCFYQDDHSCDVYALKSIQPGDELTCDYTLFDYNSSEPPEKCLCLSPNCVGYMSAFKDLKIQHQINKIDGLLKNCVRKYVVDGFLKDNGIKLVEISEHPQGVLIDYKGKYHYLS